MPRVGERKIDRQNSQLQSVKARFKFLCKVNLPTVSAIDVLAAHSSGLRKPAKVNSEKQYAKLVGRNTNVKKGSSGNDTYTLVEHRAFKRVKEEEKKPRKLSTHEYHFCSFELFEPYFFPVSSQEFM